MSISAVSFRLAASSSRARSLRPASNTGTSGEAAGRITFSACRKPSGASSRATTAAAPASARRRKTRGPDAVRTGVEFDHGDASLHRSRRRVGGSARRRPAHRLYGGARRPVRKDLHGPAGHRQPCRVQVKPRDGELLKLGPKTEAAQVVRRPLRRFAVHAARGAMLAEGGISLDTLLHPGAAQPGRGGRSGGGAGFAGRLPAAEFRNSMALSVTRSSGRPNHWLISPCVRSLASQTSAGVPASCSRTRRRRRANRRPGRAGAACPWPRGKRARHPATVPGRGQKLRRRPRPRTPSVRADCRRWCPAGSRPSGCRGSCPPPTGDGGRWRPAPPDARPRSGPSGIDGPDRRRSRRFSNAPRRARAPRLQRWRDAARPEAAGS